MLLFPVASFKYLMEDLSPEEAGSWPIPSVIGWMGSLVTNLPPPAGPENPPLLSLGYPVAQRAYLEVDLDCWPRPFIPHP